jgi:hypothetical protein
MSKPALIIVAVLVAGVFALVSPFIYLGIKSARQIRALQNRSDYSQIALACVALAQSATNDMPFIKPTDLCMPALLRSLAPRYINATSNRVTVEFHGGFDHYGYQVRQSETNAAFWTISWYTERGERLLTTIAP